MQEKITLLQKEQVEEEEEDEAIHGILIEELQHCSPDKVQLHVYWSQVSLSRVWILIWALVKRLTQTSL